MPAPYFPLTPARICDTRSNGNTTPCVGKTLSAGGTLTVQVTGEGGVPAGATAVVANVTATGATAQSFLTAYPEGSDQAARLEPELQRRTDRPEPGHRAALGEWGDRHLQRFGHVNAVVDVSGYYGPGSRTGLHLAHPGPDL